MRERPSVHTNRFDSEERGRGFGDVALRAVIFVAIALSLAACGGGSEGPGTSGFDRERAAEAAYQKAYRDGWVQACKAAVAEIRKDANPRPGARAAKVRCARPVEQMAGTNTAFDPAQAAADGREQGTFDGCTYAWDETFGSAGEVEPRC